MQSQEAMNEDFLYPKFDFEVDGDGRLVWGITSSEMRDIIHKEIEDIQDDPVWNLARELFSREDKHEYFELSPAQLELFKIVFYRKHLFSQTICSTQYGKTLTVSRAVLCRLSSIADDYLLVVPDTKRGNIFMDYIIEDASENEYFKKKLVGIDLDEKNEMKRMLEHKSKLKLTFQIIENKKKVRYSSIEIISCEARRKKDVLNTIMGFGGKNVITDESSLIDDEIEAGIFRMISGRGEDVFYLKIGNPFYRNHFFKSWLDKDYKKVYINDDIGIADGRYSKIILDKALEKPKYNVLFGSRFPRELDQDEQGWTVLLTENQIRNALIPESSHIGNFNKLGCDVAGDGSNESVIVRRSPLVASVEYKSTDGDTAAFALKILEKKNLIVVDTNREVEIAIDSIGVGNGTYNICKSQTKNVIAVVAGSSVDEKIHKLKSEEGKGKKKQVEIGYFNMRALMYWRLRTWILSGGKLVGDWNTWQSLRLIKYRISSGKKIQIIPKEEISQDIESGSPDIPDSLAHTFWTLDKETPIIPSDPINMLLINDKNKSFRKDKKVGQI